MIEDIEKMEKYIEERIRENISVKEKFIKECQTVLPIMADIIARSIDDGGRLLIFGNGGSASDSQHLAAEFVNRLKKERMPLPAISLTTDSSIITSIGNDYGFDLIFEKQIMAIGQPGDVALGISTSGLSLNVNTALKFAKSSEIYTLGFTGRGSKLMSDVCDYVIHVDSDDTAIIQECHIMAAHILCKLVEDFLFDE